MNILVIDDEYYARKAMVQLIEDWDAQSSVREAENGYAALERIAEETPDLVFSDIRMPGMDGIELAAHLHEHHPSVANVIISGYDDFHYAQQAIRYKVQHYLLKPADTEQIVPLLDFFRRRTERSAAQLLEMRLTAALYEERPLDGILAGASVVAVLRANAAHGRLLEPLVQKELDRRPFRHVTIRDRQYADVAVVWMYVEDTGSGAGAGLPAEALEALNAIVRENAEAAGTRGISAGMSAQCGDVRDVPAAYKEAKRALLHRLVAGGGQVYGAGEAGTHCQYNSVWIDEWLSLLYSAAVKKQGGKAAELIRKSFAAAAGMPLSVPSLRDMCAKTTAVLNSAIELANERGGEAAPFWEPIDLHEYESLDDIADCLAGMALATAERLRQSREEMDTVEDVKRYVRQNYKQDIQLEHMAKTVYYCDPSYLTRLFKKKTGLSLMQFLLAERLNRARQLLASDTSLTVSEVAGAVGFNDYSHFIQMYKKSFGETPGQFKKRTGRETGSG